MKESNEGLTESELRKKAYLIGLRLKNSGADAKTIYARLRDNGMPEELAKVVVQDVLIERKNDAVESAFTKHQAALTIIGLGAAVALITGLIFPEKPVIPATSMVIGIFSALLAQKKMRE